MAAGSSTNAPDPVGAVHWLRIALGDLATAQRLLASEDVPPRVVAELAQQAAEKALKAAIALQGVDPPRTHDVLALARLAQPGGALPEGLAVAVLAALTDAASAARYPDTLEVAYSSAEVSELVEAASALVDWMRHRLVRVGVQLSEMTAV